MEEQQAVIPVEAPKPLNRWPDTALVIAPNTLLSTPSKRVEGEDLAHIKDLTNQMRTYMTRLDGIGLSAIQISVPLRVFILDDILSGELMGHSVFINPVLSKAEGKVSIKEGCLSYPGLTVEVDRAEKITVTALDENGVEFTLTAEGMPAVAIQHEADHLDGITFLNKVSKLKRDIYFKKYTKNLKKRASQVAARNALGKLRYGQS